MCFLVTLKFNESTGAFIIFKYCLLDMFVDRNGLLTPPPPCVSQISPTLSAPAPSSPLPSPPVTLSATRQEVRLRFGVCRASRDRRAPAPTRASFFLQFVLHLSRQARLFLRDVTCGLFLQVSPGLLSPRLRPYFLQPPSQHLLPRMHFTRSPPPTRTPMVKLLTFLIYSKFDDFIFLQTK